MKLMLVGHGRHGKDTVADYIYAFTGMTTQASSWAAAEIFLYEKLKDEFGYTSINECWEDRISSDEMRARWFDEIKAYNTPHLTRLMRGIYSRYDIYTGIRNSDELIAGQQEDVISLTIWVDAIERKPPEPKSSMTVTKEMADIVIDNNGTEFELKKKVLRLCRSWGLPSKTLYCYYCGLAFKPETANCNECGLVLTPSPMG